MEGKGRSHIHTDVGLRVDDDILVGGGVDTVVTVTFVSLPLFVGVGRDGNVGYEVPYLGCSRYGWT